jgi:hypothetical protein
MTKQQEENQHHTCLCCGARLQEYQMIKVYSNSGEYWVCNNGKCQIKNSQYISVYV